MIKFIILFTLVGVFSFQLFKKAAGTLALGKVNIISYVYYLFVLQLFIGTVLVNLGYTEHYTLVKLISWTDSINMTTNVVCFTMLCLPLIILAVFRGFRFDASIEYNDFLEKETILSGKNILFILFAVILMIQFLLMALWIIKIGYIPLVKLFFHESTFNQGLERIRIQGIDILGISYIKNIVILMGVPLMSYFTASYAMATKEKRWIVLAVFAFIASVIVKTSDFAKSPLAFHLFVFLLIFIYYRKGLKNSFVAGFGVAMAVILVIFYRIAGYTGTFLDIYNGILGRTLFTQFGTLSFHFDMFPYIFDYLGGRSLSPTVMNIIGMNPELHIRSSRLVMEFYGSEGVYDGVAGVMNAAFMGEAYANFGIWGIIFSIVWVGLYIGLLFVLLIRIRKTPVTVAMMALLTQQIGSMTQGGFTDFIYSSSLIMIIGGSLILIYFDEIYFKVQRLLKKKAILKQ